ARRECSNSGIGGGGGGGSRSRPLGACRLDIGAVRLRGCSGCRASLRAPCVTDPPRAAGSPDGPRRPGGGAPRRPHAATAATLLGTTVEALFGGKQRATLPLPTRVGPVGTRLLLAEVDGHVRTHALDPSSGEPADALVEDSRKPPTLLEDDRWRRTLLLAGC